MSNLCQLVDVGYVRVWIAEGLSVEHLGVWLDSSLDSSEVANVNDGVGNALCAECMCDEVERTTIEVVGCNDVVAVLYDVLESVCYSCCTRSDCQASYTTFEGCYTILEYTLGRVGQTTIDVTCVTKTEAIGCVLRVAKHITGGLVDRHRTSVGSWIRVLLTYVQLKRLKAKFLFCTHNLCPFFKLLISD